MKKIFIILLGIVLLGACDFKQSNDDITYSSGSSYDPDDEESLKTDSTKSKLEGRLELVEMKMKDLRDSDIKYINDKTVQIEKEIMELNQKMKTIRFVCIVLFILITIAFVIYYICLKNSLKELGKRIEQRKTEIKDVKDEMNKKPISYRETQVSGKDYDSEIYGLRIKLERLENKINELHKGTTIGHPAIPERRDDEDELYFEVCTGTGYVTATTKIKEAKSRFKIYSRKGKYYFEPFDLGRLKYSKGLLNPAIEISGCELNDATKMSIDDLGEINKEGQYWRIEKKVKVTLSK